MFLKTNHRIAAHICVICLALLVFCLVEQAVRALAGLRLNPARGHDPPTIPAHRRCSQTAGAAQRRPDLSALGELTDRRP
jgi:hypothetical protein